MAWCIGGRNWDRRNDGVKDRKGRKKKGGGGRKERRRKQDKRKQRKGERSEKRGRKREGEVERTEQGRGQGEGLKGALMRRTYDDKVDGESMDMNQECRKKAGGCCKEEMAGF